MIRHIVLFKLKEFDSEKEKNEVLNLLKINLENLKSKIKEIQFFEVGIDVADSPNSYDIGLNSEFISMEDLEKYRIHPDHQKVVELLKQYTIKRVAVDYVI